MTFHIRSNQNLENVCICTLSFELLRVYEVVNSLQTENRQLIYASCVCLNKLGNYNYMIIIRFLRFSKDLTTIVIINRLKYISKPQ